MSEPIILEEYNYFPALRTRPAEVRGYSFLTQNIKDGLLPLFTLGLWKKDEMIGRSIKELGDALEGRPFLLDITRESAYQNVEVRSLLNPDDNFKNWRNFSSKVGGAIPIVQITPITKKSQVIRQARILEGHGFNKVVFRVTEFKDSIDMVTSALASLDSIENALVIIDAGYIRESMAASLAACVTAINSIREEVEETLISVISTSFPASIIPHTVDGGMSGAITILERVLHQEIGADAAVYGDHGSIHSKVYPVSGGKYTPRIDYPLYDAWVFERRPDTNANGYVQAAQQLVAERPEILEDESWGAEKIRNAADGEIDGMKTPASWIAARVNTHITKQWELSNRDVTDDEDDAEDLF